MEEKEIFNQILIIFRDVLDDPNIILTEASTADDVEEWDSLTHIQIVVSIEKHFGVKFKVQEIQGWKNVGEIIHNIYIKLQQK